MSKCRGEKRAPIKLPRITLYPLLRNTRVCRASLASKAESVFYEVVGVAVYTVYSNSCLRIGINLEAVAASMPIHQVMYVRLAK